MQVYWKHRVWTEMYELFANLDSVIRVLPDEEVQLLEAHSITVGEFDEFKEMLDDFIVQYIRRRRDVDLIRVTLREPATDEEER